MYSGPIKRVYQAPLEAHLTCGDTDTRFTTVAVECTAFASPVIIIHRHEIKHPGIYYVVYFL